MEHREAIIGVVLLALVGAAAVYLLKRQSDSADAEDGGEGGDADSSAQPSLGTDPLNYVANAFVSTSPQELGLGINNPGNLRYIEPPHNFNGQIGNVRGFGQYDTMESGGRAMGHQLQKYWNAGKRSVSDIVSTYAPATENDTSGYINGVAGELNVLPDDQIDLPNRMGELMYAMIFREQAQRPFDVATLQSWGTEP